MTNPAENWNAQAQPPQEAPKPAWKPEVIQGQGMEAGKVPENVVLGSEYVKASPDKVVEEPVDLKALFRETAIDDANEISEIRKKIEIPKPSIELSESDLEPITGVEYLNALPGGEKVEGSTYESTSEKVRTLRLKNNPLEGKQAINYEDINSDYAVMPIDESLSENLIEDIDPTLVKEKGSLPRFDTEQEENFPTVRIMPEPSTRLTEKDIINDSGENIDKKAA